MALTPTKLYQGQPGATETSLFVVAAGKTAIVKQIVVCNPTASSATLFLSLVPSGGAASAANRVIGGPTFAAATTVTFDLAQVMNAGDFASAIASLASTLTVTISGIILP